MESPRPSSRTVAALGLAAAAVIAIGCGFVNPISGDSKPLAIQRFIAVPATVAPGAATLLSWDVEGADSIELDNGIGLVQPTGSRSVRPTVTTTYRMWAVAGTSLATASIQVVVIPSGPSPAP